MHSGDLLEVMLLRPHSGQGDVQPSGMSLGADLSIGDPFRAAQIADGAPFVQVRRGPEGRNRSVW